MTVEDLVRATGAKRCGSGYIAHCINPDHEDRHESMTIGTGDDGKILVNCKVGCTQSELMAALRAMGDTGGYQNSNGHRPKHLPKKLASDVRRGVEDNGFTLRSEHAFGSRDRQAQFVHTSRTDAKSGKPEKRCLWESLDSGVWYSGRSELALPLYANSAFNPKDNQQHVVTTEGPLKADYLGELGIAAICHKHLTYDHVSSLAGRVVTIWPDNDVPGAKQADKAEEILGPHVRTLRRITPPAELGVGGDVLDAKRLGWQPDRIHQVIAEASERVIQGLPRYRRMIDIPGPRSIECDPVTWAVDRFIITAGVTLITAETGIGKTWVSLALAGVLSNAMAGCGAQWAGRDILRMPVGVCDRENPLAIIRERMEVLGIEDSPNLKYWGSWLGDEAPGPGSQIIVDYVDSCAPKPCLIFDTFISFFEGDNENDAAAVRKSGAFYRGLANRGATVILLAHVGKSESAKFSRGSSDLPGFVDTAYRLTRAGASDRLDLLKLECFKMRAQVDAEILFRFHDGRFLAGHGGGVRLVGDQCRDIIQAQPGITTRQFNDEACRLKLGRDRARQWLTAAIAKGDVRVEVLDNNVHRHYLTEVSI